MKIYLAGIDSRANLLIFNKIGIRGGQDMRIYLAGGNNKERIMQNLSLAGEESMKLYLAGEHEVKNGSVCKSWQGINILESFFYAKNNPNILRLIHSPENLLLDSGAYTFLVGKKNTEVDWERYVDEYAAFINKYNVKLFFELDIDNIVGLRNVEKLRDRLEKKTGKKSIPVWHINRGKEYFIKMCKEYPYVGLGGIAIREIPLLRFEQAFPWFINTAHTNNAKIHGLGYTCINNLKKYHFDSVDSTAWLYGNRGGYIYKFNPLTGIMEQHKKDNVRVKPRECAVHNFIEWIKLCRYADKHW